MIRSYFFLLLAICFLYPASTHACGYGFIGGCSTSIGLRINGTTDSFAIAPCQNITNFDGLHLGYIQSLALVQAKSINWSSCQNMVTGATIFFRVFRTGTPGGTWQSADLHQDYSTLVGPYTTRYRSVNTDVDLTTGLVIGEDYTVEAYFQAQVDTIGSDSIPDTYILQNKEGLNYHLTFRYGGATAPPFTVLTTKKIEPTCYGDVTGVAGVSVYGNQNGLFYHWNYMENDNFNILYNVPAGMYIVTVNGAGGYSETDTIVLSQPPAISNQFVNFVPFNCNNNGNAAQVTAQASGGVEPYSYQWSDGTTTTATLAVTTPGNYIVTVTDALGCARNFTQVFSGNNVPIFNIQADICNGETYRIGNQSFVQPGSYNITLTSTSSCDTLIHLQLGLLNPAALLADLPTTGIVTCAQPELNLCATAQPNATFFWKKDGLDAVNTPCILATAGGGYTVTATLTGANNKVCSAEKTVAIEEHLTLPTAQIGGQFSIGCVPSTTPVWLHAVTNAQNATYLWTYQGQTLSVTDSCSFVFAGWTGQGGFILPVLVVTDIYGCSINATSGITVVQTAGAPILNVYQQNLCHGLTEVGYDIFGGTPPYQTQWNNPAILTNPFSVSSGAYNGTVTDASGCVSIFTITVEPFSMTTTVQMATGPNSTNGAANVEVTGGTQPYLYKWSNGSTSAQISNQLPGSYCVTATDNDGCSLDTCIIISYVSATEEASTSNIRIAPNPVTPGDWLQLRLPEQLIGEKVEIEIFDATGRKWWYEKQESNTADLQVQLPIQTPVGLLIVRIQGAKGQAVGKCVAR